MTEFKIKFVWWIRFLIKVLLLSSKIPYKFFNKFGIFRHGAMDQDEYVEKIWKKHFINNKKYFSIPENKNFLEIGPGDSIQSAIKAKDAGFKKILFVDSGNYAIDSQDVLSSFNDIQSSCKYLINGNQSLSTLQSNTISFAFSNSVLQHIDLKEINDFLKNLFRISAQSSIQSHVIDLRDMINRSKLHMQCPAYIWESAFFKKFPIYTNRLLASDWENLFDEVGFEILESKKYDTNGLEIDITKLNINDIIADMHFVLKKP